MMGEHRAEMRPERIMKRRRKMRINDIPEIDRLSVPEKILLVEELWDRIATEESSVPIPPSHLEELERRRKRNASDPGRLLSLSELKQNLEKRK
jgi:putative addiction module component (TIGR02574 family)